MAGHEFVVTLGTGVCTPVQAFQDKKQAREYRDRLNEIAAKRGSKVQYVVKARSK